MPVLITPPPSSFEGDVKQKILGSIQSKTTALETETAADILDSDGSATLGRKILSISNNGTEPVYISYGVTATLTDFDYPLYGNRQLLDIEYNSERISAIANGAANIRVKFAKYIEV